MRIVEDLQHTIIEGTSDLSTALRKAKVLSTHLNSPDFSLWVEHELTGYPAGAEVPQYRRIYAPAFGTFSGPFGRHAENVPLPTQDLPVSVKEKTVDLSFRHTVRELESMLKTPNLRYRWTAEAVMYMRGLVEMSDGSVLIDACSVFPAGALEGILDSVRNKLLDFLLKLQQVNPEILTSNEALNTLPENRVTQIFNVTIFGDRNIVAAGEGISQNKSNHRID